ncbi:MAG TPA: TlpA disulfide reductase family protein [Acidimicrobiales bacterium]|nr:TlpA disulfide reductase family protein [Acidimicrobiales bacterium]
MSSRRRSLVIGTVAAVVALGAGIGTYVVLADDDGDTDAPLPEAEVELSFDEDDDESGVDDLIGGEVEGDPAPSDSFTLLDGGSMSLEELRGTPVVVNFFASWCVPCVEEMPAFEAVHQELGDTVQFVGIALQESPEASQGIVEETGVTYTIGRDPSGALFEAFDGVNMPSTFVLDADGIVVGASAGALDEDGLLDLVRRAG